MNPDVHLAQVNIARMKAPLDSPAMAGFVARLDEINALADRSPGFVWRLQNGSGNATYARPYDDDRIIVNLSVWENVESLRAFVYRSAHALVLRQRNEWFTKLDGACVALWWVPRGHLPSIDEARARLEHLDEHGPTPLAFTFKTTFPAAQALAKPDESNGYEAIAEAFVQARSPSIGPTVLRRWAARLRTGASILDLGCGSGVPISQALLQDGFEVYGVDASATLIAKFHERFPRVPLECGRAEESRFFGRRFDAAVAWGLMFLLPVDTQRSLIGKVARALNPHGHFLFTAPREAGTWSDAMTGRPSCSLGYEAYERELVAHGFRLVGTDVDEGDNHYYFCQASIA